MAPGMTARGDGGRGDARHGRKHAAASDVALDGGAGQRGERRGRLRADHVRPQAVADYDDGAPPGIWHEGSLPDFANRTRAPAACLDKRPDTHYYADVAHLNAFPWR